MITEFNFSILNLRTKRNIPISANVGYDVVNGVVEVDWIEIEEDGDIDHSTIKWHLEDLEADVKEACMQDYLDQKDEGAPVLPA